MARYTGPITKKSRRLGTDLVGNDKAFEHRPYPPGMHGRGRSKESEYLLQLKEKQKARYAYGVLEKQFRRYYEEANRLSGKTGDNLLIILESRLDNVVYRAGLAATRRQARQLVVHGHFTVNGRKVNIPSFLTRPGQVVAMKDGSRSLDKMKAIVEANAGRPIPKWLELNRETLEAKIVAVPNREDIDLPIEETLIVELYSK